MPRQQLLQEEAAATPSASVLPKRMADEDGQSMAESGEDGARAALANLTSNEVNYVLYNYLQETGLSHTAFSLLHESGLKTAVAPDNGRYLNIAIPPNHLVRLLHKGLLYLEAEARWRGDGASSTAASLLGVEIQDSALPPRLIRSRNRSPSPPLTAPTTPGTANTRNKPRSASNPPLPNNQPASRKQRPQPAIDEEIEQEEEPEQRKKTTLALPPNAKRKPPSEGSRSAQHSAPTSRDPSPPMDPPKLPNGTFSRANSRQTTQSPETQLVSLPSVSNKRKERDGERRINGTVEPPLTRKMSPTSANKPISSQTTSKPSENSATAMDVDSPAPQTNSPPTSRANTEASSAKQTTNNSNERDSKRVKLEIMTDGKIDTPKIPSAKPASASLTPLSTLFNDKPESAPAPVIRPTPVISVVTVRTVTAPRPPPIHSASASATFAHTNGRRSSSPNTTRRDGPLPVQSNSAMKRSTSAGSAQSKLEAKADSNTRSSSPELSRKTGPTRLNATQGGAVSPKKQKMPKDARELPAKGKGKPPLLGQIGETETITLVGHVSSSQPVSWCPNNPGILVTGSTDGTARVWDVSTQSKGTISTSVSCKHQQGSRRSDVLVVSWNHDGTLFGTGAEDGVVRIWTAAGDLYLVLPAHQKGIYSIKWNRAGTMVLTASLDCAVGCWELSTGRKCQMFETHTDGVMDCDWYDETTFASCSKDRSVHICALGRSAPVHRFRGHMDEVNLCLFDPTKTVLATCSDDHTARIWSMSGYLRTPTEGVPQSLIDQKGGTFVLEGHTAEVNGISWQPRQSGSGPRILGTASFDTTAKLWDADKGTCLYTLDRHSEVVYSISFSPLDGAYIALGSDDRKVSIFRVQDGELLCEYNHPGPVYESLWHPTKSQIAVTGRYPEVKIINLPDFAKKPA